MPFALFNGFELRLTMSQVNSVPCSGACDDAVARLVKSFNVAQQLDAIGHEKISAELSEYGVWDALELLDVEACRQRIVWLAAGNIQEENFKEQTQS